MGPVAIGGVGGSGTRVVAEMLQHAGYFIGDDLNTAHDNLWFTLLFKWPGVQDQPSDEFAALYDIFRRRMTAGPPTRVERSRIRELTKVDRQTHSPKWLRQRARTLCTSAATAEGGPWGWKEPNTHMVLERLILLEPNLRYIHVARNGLDMALSPNQNQPRLCGDYLDALYDETPRTSLRYWRLAHERVDHIAQEQLGDRYLFVRFDELCANSEPEISRLLSFFGTPDLPIRPFAEMVRPPSTMGRRGTVDLDIFSSDDVAYVEGLGFTV